MLARPVFSKDARSQPEVLMAEWFDLPVWPAYHELFMAVLPS